MQINKIYNENCLETMSRMPNNFIDLVVTSPPYDDLRKYNGYSFDFENVAKELYRVTKDGGVIVWVVGDSVMKGNKSLTSFKQAIYFQQLGFNIYDVLIYEKAGSAPPHKNRYFNTFEYMFVLSKGLPKTVHLIKDKPNKWAGKSTFGDVTRRERDGSLTSKGKKIIKPYSVRTNIWRYNNGKGFATKDKIAYKHPAIFPEQLAQDHIRSWSNEGDLVYDPFMGSGTTAKMANLLKRNWVGSEISVEYMEIINKRLAPYVKQLSIF